MMPEIIISIILISIFIIVGIINIYILTKKNNKDIEEKYIQKHRSKLLLEIDTARTEANRRIADIEAKVETAQTAAFQKMEGFKREVAAAKKLADEQTHTSQLLAQQQVSHYQSLSQEIIQRVQTEAEQEQFRLEEKKKAIDAAIAELDQKRQLALDGYAALLEEQKKAQLTQMREEVAAEAALARDAATVALSTYLDTIAQKKAEAADELAQLQEILAEYQQKTQAINEAIMRQRAIDEQQDFYRVCLSEDATQDIALLNEIRPRLHFYDNLDKLIYDVYISKPAQEAVKRILGDNKDKGGIYKITRISTGEIYIGRAVSFRDRWIQHIKSAFNVGTIADSLLHRKMREDGITNYTFEILEILPQDKQSEREKYWIEFYNSKIYGLNQRLG